jgi:hypothetical protein
MSSKLAVPVFRLARLRRKTISAAAKFHDYNFRMYFVTKTNDVYNEMSKKSDADIQAFVKGEGKEMLAQIQRMSLLNAVYARTPVFLDPAIQSTVRRRVADADEEAQDAEEGKSKSKIDNINESSLPHQGAANRKREMQPDEEDDEDKDK